MRIPETVLFFLFFGNVPGADMDYVSPSMGL